MDALLNEWLNLVLRWIHVIAGIAWIGSSFYFNWLDSKMRAPSPARGKVEGEAWLVHSGGFYRVEKTQLAPNEVPAELHWFKWEAALTWVSGFALLILLYHLGGGAFLQDAPQGFSNWLGLLMLLGGLAIGWAIYDLVWASKLGDQPVLASALLFGLLVAATWLLSKYMTGQALYLHVGALLGTIMTANVWMRILPAQRKMIEAIKNGQQPDQKLAAQAKLRSKQNTFMVVPVVFLMISNHYGGVTTGGYDWIHLAILIPVGWLAAKFIRRA